MISHEVLTWSVERLPCFACAPDPTLRYAPYSNGHRELACVFTWNKLCTNYMASKFTHCTQHSNACKPTTGMSLFFPSCRWQPACTEHNFMLENRKAMPGNQTVTQPGNWSSYEEFAIGRSCTWQTNLKQSWFALSPSLLHTKIPPRQTICNRNVFEVTLQCRH